jgi:hypothetical protein
MSTLLSDSEDFDPDRTETLPVLELPGGFDPTGSDSPPSMRTAGSPVAANPELPERLQSDEHLNTPKPAPQPLEAAIAAEPAVPDFSRHPERLALLAELEAASDALEASRQTEAAATERATAALQEAALAHEEMQKLRTELETRDLTLFEALHSLGERDSQIAALERERVSAAAALEKAAELEREFARRELVVAQLSNELAAAKAERAELLRVLEDTKAMSAAYLEALQSQDWRQAYVDSRVSAVRVATRTVSDAEPVPPSAPVAVAAPLAERVGDQASPLAGAPAPPPDSGVESDAAAGAEVQMLSERLALAERRNVEQAAQILRLEAKVDAAEDEKDVLLAHLRISSDPGDEDPKEHHPKPVLPAAQAPPGSDAASQDSHAAQEFDAAQKSDVAQEFDVAQKSDAAQESGAEQAFGAARGFHPVTAAGIVESQAPEFSAPPATPSIPGVPASPGLSALPDSSAPEVPPVPAAPPTPAAPSAPAASQTPTASPTPAGPSIPATAPVARLIRVDGGSGREYPITGRMQIGRMMGSDLRIEFASVSRLHALVLVTAEGIAIEDSNSTNGIFVNGVRVKRQILTDGDVIGIGEASLRFAIGPAGSGAPGDAPASAESR